MLRAQPEPICSLVTPGHCSHVQAMLGYAPPIAGAGADAGSANNPRRWAWESGGEYRVTEATGIFAGTETVYASGVSPAPDDSGEDFQVSLLMVTPIPEPAVSWLAVTALVTLASLRRRKN